MATPERSPDFGVLCVLLNVICVRLTNEPRPAAHGEDLMKIQSAVVVAVLAFAPVAASAESQEEQNACMNDAFNVCGHAIPDRERVGACLAHNVNRISIACRTVMQRYSKANQPAATARAKMTAARN
jgi:hypothetical protein